MSDVVTVYLVDDEPEVLWAQSELLTVAGLTVQSYHSAEEFLRDLPSDPQGCVVTDLRMGGMSGMELQRELKAIAPALPLIMVTGHATVPDAVRIMEYGAVTLLQKPYNAARLLEVVRRALQESIARRDLEQRRHELRQRLETLTEDERRVMDLIFSGKPGKAIAAELRVSMRTVERRRSIILDKMRVSSVPELARVVSQLESEVRAPFAS